MKEKQNRRIIVHYGEQPLELLLKPFQLVESGTGRDVLVGEQHLASAVGEISRTDHTVALDTAEFHGLQIGNEQDFLAD